MLARKYCKLSTQDNILSHYAEVDVIPMHERFRVLVGIGEMFKVDLLVGKHCLIMVRSSVRERVPEVKTLLFGRGETGYAIQVPMVSFQRPPNRTVPKPNGNWPTFSFLLFF